MRHVGAGRDGSKFSASLSGVSTIGLRVGVAGLGLSGGLGR